MESGEIGVGIFIYTRSFTVVKRKISLFGSVYILDVLIVQGKSLKTVGGQVCQICGDNVGSTEKGELFIACDVCAFPVCRPCYEYERKDGNQSCPQCKTRYKRQKGFDF